MSDLVAAAQAGKAPAGQERPKTARDVIEDYEAEFTRALAGRADVQHFIRSGLSVVSATPKLQTASPRSLVGAMLLAAQLNLEIGGGLNQFHLTPRTVKEKVQEGGRTVEKWVDVCVPIIGYQGFVTLAYRNQRTLDFNKVRVYENDEFDDGYTSERGKYFEWHPAKGSLADRGALAGVLVASRTMGGGRIETWLSVEEIEARRPASSKEQTVKGGDRAGQKYTPNTPWKTDYAAMADKTVIREHGKLLPKSVELQTAIALDERVLVANRGVQEPTVLDTSEDED